MNKTARGRPREYDREEVLSNALDMFSVKGYAATSLDDISDAMNMSRPSIYNAFGDKEMIYLHAMEVFRQQMRTSVERFINSNHDLPTALSKIYNAALSIYFAKKPAQGCFIFCTAPAEVITHQQIKNQIAETLVEVDMLFEKLFRKAQDRQEYPVANDATQAGKLAQAVLHTLAIRARAGDTKASLKRLVEFSVKSIV
jgi:AcrR family transcriptional regulator